MSQTLRAACHHELLIRKSRFIACVEPIDGRDAAQRRVAALRAAHPGAAHVCWALLAAGQSAAVDDGEPGGTAGRPMLDVLRHQDLDGVMASVVRYFGGIKLGAGGLVRAYTDAVAQALLSADKVTLLRWHALACVVPYSLEGWLRRELAAHSVADVVVTHATLVRFDLRLPEPDVDAFVARINDGGRGQVGWIDSAR